MQQHSIELYGAHGWQLPHYPNYRLGPLEGSPCDTLGIEKAVYILAHPYPFEACVGGEAHFEVTAFGTGKGYQWQQSTDGGSSWEDLADGGHFSDTQTEYLLLHDVPASFEGQQYRCTVSGNVSTDTSRVATLTLIGEAPTLAIDFFQDKDSLFFESTADEAQYLRWWFGDGDSTTLASPTHLYLAEGSYTATAVATNACGEDTATVLVDIAPLWADFTADRTFGCAPLTVTFTDLSPYRVKNAQFFSYDDDGNYVGFANNPSKTYTDTGSYHVHQFVYNSPESADTLKENYITVLTGTNPTADIELSQNGSLLTLSAPFDLADEYVWYFANGDSLTGQLAEYEISAPGIYPVQLATTNHCGTAVGSIEVLVGELEAAFSAGATVGCAPFTVQFQNQTAFANAGFVWLLPGAQPGVSQELAPVVTYAQPGLYDATLVVWADSLSDTLTIEDYIEVLPDDCPQATLATATDGLTLTAWTDCPDGLNFTWLLGNGDQLNTPAVAYEYPEPGTYGLTAIVAGPCTSDTLTATVTVDGPSSTGSRDGRQLVHLAPNPANGSVLVISEGQPFGEASFGLYSPQGVLVLQKEEAAWGRHQRIGLAGLPGGVYFYRFQAEGAPAQVGRMVVE